MTAPRSRRPGPGLRWLALLVAGSALAISPAGRPASGGPQDPDSPQDPRTALMRQKLDHAQRILGGLTEGRFGPISRSARALEEISREAARHNLPTADYRRFSDEFRRLTASLAKHADAEDLDAATLAYVQLTINCVDCHKYVRIQTLPAGPPQ
ncbi:hypothetical protein [Tautonia sociabilis]|uniref:Cytochrome c n=1 Tax=Tautonia sociabilis TaxID=2080755 RepID=A0A432MHI3_9BACT|nr:hypothetical protein [Tautonia sociabilis]RUL86296.1 hypothetical protein TsocGM_16325 [Tautonia sociabilis]